ncbi:MAG: hypothetical protein WCW25_02025 [Patescibacteria group bacterium]|jgi:hypothetical protein
MFEFFSKFIGKNNPVNPLASVKDDFKNQITDESLNISVHVMPKRFRVAAHLAKKSRSAGTAILFGGIVLLFLLGGAGYYYIFVKQAARTGKEPLADETENQNETVPATDDENVQKEKEKAEAEMIEDAKQNYLSYKKSLAEADTLDDYERAFASLAGADLLADWQDLKVKADKLGEDKKEEFLALLKNFRPLAAEIESVMSGAVKDNGVSLSAGATGFTVAADLAGSNGSWKLTEESGFEYLDADNATTTPDGWLNANETPKLPENEIEYKPGSDADADGLTDKEEEILGTNFESNDSDADGYPDLSELNNYYNPAGAGRLAENPGIKKYSDIALSFEILYPAGWSEEKSGGEAIILRSSDNQFLQALIQPNPDKEDIEAWYLKQFDITAVPDDWKTEKETLDGQTVWQGIKSPDGLTMYLTDADKEYIYVLTYSPGEGRTLDYQNIFNMVIASFTLL